jgi:CHRD domain-containing protein
MIGANERPNPVTTTGSGSFSATLGANDILTYSVTFTGLTSNSNNAHIHGPIPAQGNAAAGVLINFNEPSNGRTITFGSTSGSGTGTIDLKVGPNANISADSFKVLLNNGKLYVNVHTVTNGGGEILGIITKP